MDNFISIYTCFQPTNKKWTLDNNQQLQSAPTDFRQKYFDPNGIGHLEFESLADIYNGIQQLNASHVVFQGYARPDAHQHITRYDRSKKETGAALSKPMRTRWAYKSEEAEPQDRGDIEDIGNRFFPVDFDNIDMGCDWRADIPGNVDRLVKSFLPPCMHNVSYVYRLSGGCKPSGTNLIKCHLFFISDIPLMTWEKKAFLESWGCCRGRADFDAAKPNPIPDDAIYRPAQALFLGPPTFPGTMQDPFSGMRFGYVQRSAETFPVSRGSTVTRVREPRHALATKDAFLNKPPYVKAAIHLWPDVRELLIEHGYDFNGDRATSPFSAADNSDGIVYHPERNEVYSHHYNLEEPLNVQQPDGSRPSLNAYDCYRLLECSGDEHVAREGIRDLYLECLRHGDISSLPEYDQYLARKGGLTNSQVQEATTASVENAALGAVGTDVKMADAADAQSWSLDLNYFNIYYPDLVEELRNWVFILDTSTFRPLDPRSGRPLLLTRPGFDAALARFLTFTKGVQKIAPSQAMHHIAREINCEAVSDVFYPDDTAGRIIDVPSVGLCYNRYRSVQAQLKETKDDNYWIALSYFTELIDRITGWDRKSGRHITQFLAHVFQKPLEKPQFCLILTSAPGVGKNNLMTLLRKIFGTLSYCPSLPVEDMKKGFTDSLDEGLVIFLDELKAKQSGDIVNILKGVIGVPEVNIGAKGEKAETKLNYSRIFGTANERVPLHIDPDSERKFLFIEGNRTPDYHKLESSVAFSKAFNSKMSEQWFQDSVYTYLMNYDLSDYHATGPAPDTKKKQQILAESKGTLLECIESILDTKQGPFEHDVFIVNDLTNYIREIGAFRNHGSIAHENREVCRAIKDNLSRHLILTERIRPFRNHRTQYMIVIKRHWAPELRQLGLKRFLAQPLVQEQLAHSALAPSPQD